MDTQIQPDKLLISDPIMQQARASLASSLNAPF
jgi:hypothetical protein